jgi:uncharacterized membrane protein (DUF441 family)
MDKFKEMLKDESTRKLARVAVLISATILIILGGLGLSYGTDKVFWLFMLLLGSVFAYALMTEMPVKQQERDAQKTHNPSKTGRSLDNED